MKRDLKRDESGFTLVELMISVVLFSFAVAGILAVAVTITRSFREQRRVIAAEQAARGPLDFLIDAVRQSSPAVPTSTSLKDGNSPCTSGAISFTDNTNAPDELEIVYASGGVVSTTHSAVTGTSTSITIPSVHLDQFALGDYVVVSDGGQGTLLKVEGVTSTALTIAPATACAANFPTSYAAKSILVRAQRAKFTISNLAGIPTLWMEPDGAGTAVAEPVTEGVEDMQIALGIDKNSNGVLNEVGAGVDDDEWVGNYPGDTLLSGNIRAIRIVLVTRENAPMMRANYYRPTVLNRSGTTSPDQYRRRVLSSTVEIRNLTGSP